MNAEFNTDLAGWQLPGVPTPLWASFDVSGNAASGSAQLTNAEAAAGARVIGLRRCLRVTRDRYALSASGFVAAGPSAGRMVLNGTARASTDCSGGSFASAGVYLTAANSPGVWQTNATANLDFSALAVGSIEVLLSIDKTPEGGSVTGYIDAVRLVALPLFAGGFE